MVPEYRGGSPACGVPPLEYGVATSDAARGQITAMTTRTSEIIEAALHLPCESRALLAEKLLETLDYEEPFDVDARWLDEIRRRCGEIDDEAVDLVPAGKVFSEELDKFA